jgi:hypothetical protein
MTSALLSVQNPASRTNDNCQLAHPAAPDRRVWVARHLPRAHRRSPLANGESQIQTSIPSDLIGSCKLAMERGFKRSVIAFDRGYLCR